MITSTDEKTESIPSMNKVRKNRIDHSHGGVISDSACGYETKINSGPAKGKSSMGYVEGVGLDQIILASLKKG